MRFIGSALAFAVAVLFGSAAHAQSGGFVVKVTDADGAILPGATVTIGNDNGFVKTTTQVTSPKGEVLFPVLRPGDGYWIKVTFPGFAEQTAKDLRVRIGAQQVVPFQMIEDIVEVVKVTAKSDVINIETTEQVTKFDEGFIADLPVPGRNYTNVLTMAPGVQDADGDGNPNVNGSRSRDFSAMVGGVRNVNPLTGQRMSEVNPNSIEEMEVITAGAGAEYGRAQGGFANIVQKQGSNTHEGTFEFFLRTYKLDGTGARNLNDVIEPDFDQFVPSISMAGPLMRDRLWYSIAHQRFLNEEPLQNAGSFVTEDTEAWSHQDLVTWQVSPRNKLSFQYQADPLTLTNFGVTSFRPPESAIALEQGTNIYQMRWQAPYSPRILVDSSATWQEYRTEIGANTAGVRNTCVGGTDFLELAQCTDLLTGQISGSFPARQEDFSQRLTVQGSAEVFGPRLFGVSHTFKVGLMIENERYFRQLTAGPTVAHIQISDPASSGEQDGGDEESQSPDSYGLSYFNISVPETDDIRATSTNWGIFLQDEFRPRSNMSVEIGFRFDREEINSEGHSIINGIGEFNTYLDVRDEIGAFGTDGSLLNAQSILPVAYTGFENFAAVEVALQDIICDGVPATELGQCKIMVSEDILNQNEQFVQKRRRASDLSISNTVFSPRLAFSWDPKSNGKMFLRASAGRYYNNNPLIIPLIELEPAQINIRYRTDNCSPSEADEGECSPTDPPSSRIDGGIVPTVTIQSVDPNLKIPYQDEFSVAFDRELWAETSMQVRYLRREFRDQLQDYNLNLDVGDFGACRYQVTPDDDFIESTPGMGGTLVNPFTGQVYVDTEPGIGDGIVDDCQGDIVLVNENPDAPLDPFGQSVRPLRRPDGIADLYVQSPLWGDIFLVSNINEIDYESWTLQLTRRQYRGWQMNASYTWSEAVGDGEDFFQEIGDDPSLRAAVRGFQAYDVTHSVKVQGTTITPWGFRVGANVSWQSGLPFSVLLAERSDDAVPTIIEDDGIGTESSRVRQRYPTGVRNDQRNESFWNVDLKLTKEMRLPKGLNLQVTAEVFNALNDGTYTVYNRATEIGQQVNGNNEAFFRFGRRWQVGAKVSW